MITKSEIMYIVETDKGYILECSCTYADDCMKSVYVSEYTLDRSKACRYSDEDSTRKIAEHVNGKVHTLLVTENVEVISDKGRIVKGGIVTKDMIDTLHNTTHHHMLPNDYEIRAKKFLWAVSDQLEKDNK